MQGVADALEAALVLVADRDPQRYDGRQLIVRGLEQGREPGVQRGRSAAAREPTTSPITVATEGQASFLDI